MGIRVALLVCCAVSGVASAEPKPVDITKLVGLRVFQTPWTSVAVILPPSANNEPRLFYGDGKTLYEVPARDRFLDDRSWSFVVDPFTTFESNGTEHGIYCPDPDGKHRLPMTERTGELAKSLVAKAKVYDEIAPWRSKMLARDGVVYYYVDTDRGTEKQLRLFVGKKGALKRVAVENDSPPDGFALRLKGTNQQLRWSWPVHASKPVVTLVKGGKTTELAAFDNSMTTVTARTILKHYGTKGIPCADKPPAAIGN